MDFASPPLTYFKCGSYTQVSYMAGYDGEFGDIVENREFSALYGREVAENVSVASRCTVYWPHGMVTPQRRPHITTTTEHTSLTYTSCSGTCRSFYTR